MHHTNQKHLNFCSTCPNLINPNKISLVLYQEPMMTTDIQCSKYPTKGHIIFCAGECAYNRRMNERYKSIQGGL